MLAIDGVYMPMMTINFLYIPPSVGGGGGGGGGAGDPGELDVFGCMGNAMRSLSRKALELWQCAWLLSRQRDVPVDLLDEFVGRSTNDVVEELAYFKLLSWGRARRNVTINQHSQLTMSGVPVGLRERVTGWFRRAPKIPRYAAFAVPSLYDDESYVSAAVKQNWRNIRWASARLLRDPELVRIATASNWRALLIASSRDSRAFRDADPGLRNDRKVALAVMRENGRALKWASPKQKEDYEIVLAALTRSHTCWVIKYAGPGVRNHLEIKLRLRQARVLWSRWRQRCLKS